MGLVDDIKTASKKVGTNKSKFLYFRAGTKLRIRFLSDMDDGFKVAFHDSFAAGINLPCQTAFDRECPYCDDDELRTRDQYAWSVFDYEANEVKILLAAVNQCSPVPSLVAMYESYGTLTDRDYVITKTGKQQSTTFSVVPQDKATFRNAKAKAYSSKKFFELLDAAFPVDELEDEKPAKKKTSAKKKAAPAPVEDDEEEEVDYSEMSAKELYNLCVERDIDVPAKKTEKFYIGRLEEYDAEQEAEDEADGDDYDDMTAKELYNLCKSRDIDAPAKKPEAFYIKKLRAADEAGEEEEDDEWG